MKGGFVNHDLMKDEIIKKLFTSKVCGKKLSAALIANVINVDEKIILDNLEFIHPNISSNINNVNSVVDTVLENDKMIVNIEFNYSKERYTSQKNQSYIVQLCISQIRSFKDYGNFKPVIQINLDNYDFFGKDKIMYSVKLMETSLYLTYSDNIQIYHLNLSQLRKQGYNKNNSLEKLLYLFVCKDKDVLDKLYEGDELMSKVRKEAQSICDNIDWSMLYYDPEELQRKNREYALNEKYQEGIIARNIQIINNMLKANFTKEQILQSLDISENEYYDLIQKEK